MLTSVNKIYKGEGICKMWIGMKPLVMLYRPDDVEVKMKTNNTNFFVKLLDKLSTN